MKYFFWFICLCWFIFVIGISCSFMSTGLKEPENQNTLLVTGSIVIDLFEYHNITQSYRADVEVIIAGRYQGNGKTVYKNFWTRTDDFGYFVLPNVPKGDYALRGFRFTTVGPAYYLTVVNPLQQDNDEFRVIQHEKIPSDTEIFTYPALNRVVNLRHNYFIIDRGQSVHHKVYFRLDQLRLVSGKTIDEPDVLTYLKQKYPNSKWFQRANEE